MLGILKFRGIAHSGIDGVVIENPYPDIFYNLLVILLIVCLFYSPKLIKFVCNKTPAPKEDAEAIVIVPLVLLCIAGFVSLHFVMHVVILALFGVVGYFFTKLIIFIIVSVYNKIKINKRVDKLNFNKKEKEEYINLIK